MVSPINVFFNYEIINWLLVSQKIRGFYVIHFEHLRNSIIQIDFTTPIPMQKNLLKQFKKYFVVRSMINSKLPHQQDKQITHKQFVVYCHSARSLLNLQERVRLGINNTNQTRDSVFFDFFLLLLHIIFRYVYVWVIIHYFLFPKLLGIICEILLEVFFYFTYRLESFMKRIFLITETSNNQIEQDLEKM